MVIMNLANHLIRNCDTNPFMVLVASRFMVYSGKLHQPTKITRNDIIDDVIITDDIIGHVTHKQTV